MNSLFSPEDPASSEVLVAIFRAGIKATVGDRYLYWDRLRHLDPPEGLTHAQWWTGVKLARSYVSTPLPLVSSEGRPFVYSLPDPALEMLHHIDQDAAGEILLSEAVVTPQDRGRYVVNSLLEEAITSSQLEGASTTRKVAKDMIRTGRQPRDRSERMIFNNWRAMNLIRGLGQEPLTPSFLLELHRVVTDGTLDDETAAGRLQRPDEVRVEVADPVDGTLLHRPPPAEQLPQRLEALCAFANSATPTGFLHPVIRSILIHLCLAYDHPFQDGNGRTARTLFYWSMLRHGYWLAEYISISRVLRKAKPRYNRSFLYTEIDGFDATYFILGQLRVIRQAIGDLQGYLRRKMHEVREIEGLLRRTDLNHRQLALLSHALRHPDAEYSYRSHATSHNVVRQSARTDLLDLEQRGLLQRRTSGQTLYFRPIQDLRASIGGAADAGAA